MNHSRTDFWALPRSLNPSKADTPETHPPTSPPGLAPETSMSSSIQNLSTTTVSRFPKCHQWRDRTSGSEIPTAGPWKTVIYRHTLRSSLVKYVVCIHDTRSGEVHEKSCRIPGTGGRGMGRVQRRGKEGVVSDRSIWSGLTIVFVVM